MSMEMIFIVTWGGAILAGIVIGLVLSFFDKEE